MTQSELQEIKDRAEAATAGPWGWDEDDELWSSGFNLVIGGRVFIKPTDKALIRHSRTDIPALIAYIEVLEADNAELDKLLGECRRRL